MHMKRLHCILLLIVALPAGVLAAADLQPPPEPANLSNKERSALIAIYQSLVEDSMPLKVGDSEQDLRNRLGQPDGIMTIGGRRRLSYGKGSVTVANDTIVGIDGIPEEMLTAPSRQAYEDYQMAMGNVYYMGQWMSRQDALDAYAKAVQDKQLTEQRISMGKSAKAVREQQIAISKTPFYVFKRNGDAIHLSELLAPGKVTVVDFYADWCGPCKTIEPYLRSLANDPEVAVRKVDIVGWGSPVARQWGLESIPNMRVYDKQGKQVGEPTHDIREIYKYIRRAKRS